MTRSAFKVAHGRRETLALILLLASVGWHPMKVCGQTQPPENLRQQASSALEEILGEVISYKDAPLRIRVKSQIADVLWPTSETRSKKLLLEADDEISSLKAELNERYKLRGELINIARRHDPEFASKLLARSEPKDEQSRELLQRDSVERISERGAHYLDSARDLLSNGDQERALSFARRSFLEGRSSQFIWFLNELRGRDRAAADKFFLEALVSLRRPGTDPNDVLYFGLYIFRPGQIIVGSLSEGVEAISYGISFKDIPSPPLNLVRPYLHAAAESLHNFQVVPGQPDSLAAIALKRFALGQLLPLYERYDPERAAIIQAELARLSEILPSGRSAKDAAKTERPAPASVEEAIEQIERLPTSKERDHYFFIAAQNLLEREDFKAARRFAARISEDKLKQPALQLIDFRAAEAALKSGELDEAITIADASLLRSHRAIIYHQVSAKWLAKGDQERASELMYAAITEAGKSDDPAQRAGVYIYMAAGFADREPLRAFELIETALKDINAVEDFNLIDEKVGFKMQTGLGASYSFTITEGESLLQAMSRLALADPARAISLGRALRSPEMRAYALISVCRSVLRVTTKPVKKA